MWRQPTTGEMNLILKLLSADFQGSAALRKQLENCTIQTVDDEGSFQFNTSGACDKAFVKGRVPVEAEYLDQETDDPLAPKVRLLLHVVDGYLKELEIYKDDGQPILKSAMPADLEVHYW